MVTKRESEMWKKLLGTKMKSFTVHAKTYTLFLGEHGWTCDCMDFKVRKGSHIFEYRDDDGKFKRMQACKHIGQHLANQGVEIYEIRGFQKQKICPANDA